ncbi:probable mediator of RNA polymerase II transcription subunit 26b [Amaranthus tricolor]|uniref:probable mediator of RNA polymerase II transcription subunit 26b n=1 Tax=Amaranthus tricolor TaxID=29722 RepID=UPI00258302A0|nr:probable mediator of RNA polymerase II transcription subunit 26b [Amaranthus tricolor]
MTSKSGGGHGLDNWRDFFRKAKNSDIFDIIENSIMVAASDCPEEFRVRRERIAELLFTCRLTRCLGCERVESAVSEVDDVNHGDVKVVIKGVDQFNHDVDNHHVNGGDGSKESKVNSTIRDNYDHIDQVVFGEDLLNHESNFSYGDAEALTDAIEETNGIIEEVFRIKNILLNNKDESDSVLFESLRRLQLMALTVDILKTTEIGKAVNRIRKHISKEIRQLARQLIDGWKILVDEWVKATQELAGGTPDSVNPSTLDEEEGLPSPPLDEGAFFSTQAMDFTQFFDGMDDDGNPRNCGEFNKNRDVREVGRKPAMAKQDPPKWREEPPKQAIPLARDNKVQQPKRPEPLPKLSKTPNTQSGPGRPIKLIGESKMVKEPNPQQKFRKPLDQRRPPPQHEKAQSSSEIAVQEKLEATKRKLQERYQHAENAKRQRTIQVMEIHDLPKQGLSKPNPYAKFGNNRNWANGRR